MSIPFSQNKINATNAVVAINSDEIISIKSKFEDLNTLYNNQAALITTNQAALNTLHNDQAALITANQNTITDLETNTADALRQYQELKADKTEVLVREFTSGSPQGTSHQPIPDNAITPVSLGHKVGMNYWNNNQYTIQNTGTFIITATLGLAAPSDEMYSAYLAVHKNNSASPFFSSSFTSSNVDYEDDIAQISLNLTTMETLNINDLISLKVFALGSSAIAVKSQTQLVIHRVD